MLAYTEFAAEVTAYFLFEVYYSRQLWAFSRDMIQRIRRLNF